MLIGMGGSRTRFVRKRSATPMIPLITRPDGVLVPQPNKTRIASTIKTFFLGLYLLYEITLYG
jgi:hypothetical protein